MTPHYGDCKQQISLLKYDLERRIEQLKVKDEIIEVLLQKVTDLELTLQAMKEFYGKP